MARRVVIGRLRLKNSMLAKRNGVSAYYQNFLLKDIKKAPTARRFVISFQY